MDRPYGRQQEADRDHGLEGEPDHVDRRLVRLWDLIESPHFGVRVVVGEDAERLNTTRGALYKTIHDARRKLRAALATRELGVGEYETATV